MSADLVAANRSVLHSFVSRTEKTIGKPYHSLLERCGCGNYLKGGARLIGIADAWIPPHGVELFVQLLFVQLRLHRTAEHRLRQHVRLVQIKLRNIYHRIDFPVLRVHDNDADAVRTLRRIHLFRCLLRVLLDHDVQARMQMIAVHRLDPVLRCVLKLQPVRGRQRQNRSRRPLKKLVILHLKTDNALVVAPRKAENPGCKRTVRVKALVILIYHHAVQPEIPDFVRGFLRDIGTDSLDRGIFFNALPHGRLRKLQNLRKPGDYLLGIRNLVMYDGDRADWFVVRQHNAVAVVNQPPLRFDASLPLMQLPGALRIPVRDKNHEPCQPPRYNKHAGNQHDNNQKKSSFLVG